LLYCIVDIVYELLIHHLSSREWSSTILDDVPVSKVSVCGYIDHLSFFASFMYVRISIITM
jgi:hypothetical protein